MSEVDNDLLAGFDPTDTSDTDSRPEWVNVPTPATCIDASLFVFPSSGDSVLRFTYRADEGPNKGMRAQLQFPAAPEYTTWQGGVRVPTTDDKAEIGRAHV